MFRKNFDLSVMDFFFFLRELDYYKFIGIYYYIR